MCGICGIIDWVTSAAGDLAAVKRVLWPIRHRGPDELAVYGDVEARLTLPELVRRYLGEVDLVLVEGFRQSGVPKIIFCRQGADRAPYDANGDLVIGVVGDMQLPGGKPHFPLDDPGLLADFLQNELGLSPRS